MPEGYTTEDSKTIHKTFNFKLITPMFGGDAESWEIDTKNPVRSQSVKGMLRFWWRTMQSDTDPQQLLYKENSVWGGKTGDNAENSNRCQSPVKISVINQGDIKQGIFQAKERNNRFTGVEDDIIPAYVLFPITDKVKNNEPIAYIENLTFQLQISFPENLEEEVMNTLKLWCLFGGVGARTRRGTGSIYCKELLKDFSDEEDIKQFISSFGTQNEQLLYPRVSGAILAVQEAQNSDTSSLWHGMLTAYGNYRQGPGAGRNPGNGNHPGRSYWPEPDSIRNIDPNYHGGRHNPEHRDINWFPRAAFGLPIQFEFRGEPTDPQGKIMLEPNINTGERWPSPVILKVIKLPNGKIYKTTLVLNQLFPNSLILKSNRGLNYTLVNNEMPTNMQNKIMKTNDPLNGRSIYGHLIDFLRLEVVE